MQFSSIFRVGRRLFSLFFPLRKATGSMPLFTADLCLGWLGLFFSLWERIEHFGNPVFCRLFQQSWTQQPLLLKVSKPDPGFFRHPWRVGLNWIPKFPGTASAVAPFFSLTRPLFSLSGLNCELIRLFWIALWTCRDELWTTSDWTFEL